MPTPFAPDDRVRVRDREPVAADVKSQLFYEHYRNLVGTVAKVYADGTAAINVEPGALPKELAARHGQSSSNLRQKWLDSLSEEARNKLSSSEKSFTLRYTILVAQSDLDLVAEGASLPAPKAAAQIAEPAEPPRKTLAELEAEEARHLEERRKKDA
jgi:hypothetical protein